MPVPCPCNVFIVGFGNDAESIREKVLTVLQRENGGHESVTSIILADVKCAEIPEKPEPFLRVYAEDVVGGQRVAQTLCDELGLAVEVVALVCVCIPK